MEKRNALSSSGGRSNAAAVGPLSITMLRASAVAILLLDLADTIGGLIRTPAGQRLLMAAPNLGMALLLALAVLGIWRRTRWGMWLGGVLFTVYVLSYLLALLPQVSLGAAAVVRSGIEVVVGPLMLAAYVLFLRGLMLHRRARQIALGKR